MFCANGLGTCLRARAIVLEPKFIDLDEPAGALVKPTQAHLLRKPDSVPYWGIMRLLRQRIYFSIYYHGTT